MEYNGKILSEEEAYDILLALDELANSKIQDYRFELESLTKIRNGYDERIKDLQKLIAQFQAKCPHIKWEYICTSHNGAIYECECCKKTETQ